jgi:EmrB/QacA subfamily drug resistance transporter
MKQRSESSDTAGSGSVATALVVATAAFLQLLDSSIIGTALPQMASTFGVGPVEVGLGIIAYVLAASILIPAAAWIADRFEARRIFVLAMLGFTATSFLCGMCTSLPAFVAARALQGAAGALMAAIGQLILVRSVDRSSLLRLMNISSIPMLVAPVLGPPIGGLLTELFGWPWIFFINLPIGLAAAGLALRFIKPLPVVRRPFDLLGFALNAGTLSLLVIGLERLTGTGARALAVAILAAGLALGWLAVRHLRRHPHPIMSLAPLDYPTFRIAVATALPLMRLPIGALLFVLPIQLQIGLGMSAFLSGIALLSHAAGDLMMKPLMTRTFRRFGYRTVLLASTVTMAVSIGACGLFTASTPFATILVVAYVAGAGRSFVMTGLSSLAYDEIPETQTPSAVLLNQIVLQVGAALSVALATIVFEISAAVGRHPSGQIGVDDCRNVLLVLALIGTLAVPALLRLRRDAGDRLSGRSPAVPLEE